GSIYGLHWLQPLAGTNVFSQSLDVGADYKSVRTEVFPDAPASSDGSASSTTNTPVTAPVKYINWSGLYSAAWRLPTRIFTTSFGINFGVRDLANHTDTFENARYQASPDYLYLRFSGSALQSLPAGFAVLGRLSAQWADSPLVNNEQFSLG